METFHQTICNGLVGDYPNSLGSEEPYQLLPKMELELSSSIGYDDKGDSKSRKPSGNKCVSNCLSRYICYRNCFWPACEMVHTCQYVKPLDGGNGPTMSRWTLSTRASGVAKVENGVTMCRCIFDLSHCRHVNAHFLMSKFMLGHTNRLVTRRCAVRTP